MIIFTRSGARPARSRPREFGHLAFVITQKGTRSLPRTFSASARLVLNGRAGCDDRTEASRARPDVVASRGPALHARMCPQDEP
jgi:hypothetical protein